MRKLMTMMLGLTLAFGAATCYAAGADEKTEKKESKKKKKKKAAEDKK